MIQAGIVGYGDVARKRYGDILTGTAVRVAAVCDVRRDAREAARVRWPNVRTYERMDDMIRGESIELVIVLTPGSTHENLVRQLLESGKSVYCEKPLALTTQVVENLFEIADKKGCSLVVAPALDRAPAVAAVSKLLRSNVLGRAAQAHFSCVEAGPAKSPWFGGCAKGYYGRMGGGCLYDLGIYALHLAVTWFGTGAMIGGARSRSVDRVVARSGDVIENETADCWALVMSWPNGPVATVDVSWCGHGGGVPSATIVCEKGTVKVPIFWLHECGNVEVWRETAEGVVHERLGEMVDVGPPARIGMGIAELIESMNVGKAMRNVSDVCEVTRLLESAANNTWDAGALRSSGGR